MHNTSALQWWILETASKEQLAIAQDQLIFTQFNHLSFVFLQTKSHSAEIHGIQLMPANRFVGRLAMWL